MKPFLGIDLTNDRKNEEMNGTEFLVMKPSDGLLHSLYTAMEEAEDTVEESQLPWPLRILKSASGLIALLVAVGIMRSAVSLAEGYRNAPFLYWIAGICGIVWVLLFILEKRKSSQVLESDESVNTFSHCDGVVKAIFTELSVPDDAKEVDILSFYYKEQDGTIRVKEKAMQLCQFMNPIFHAFADKETLYLANAEGKYAFPLSSITAIRTVKKHIRIMEWNKEEGFNEGIYKPYHLKSDNYGCIHCKCYHIIELTHHGEPYGIYIPNYELPVFEALTGLKAQPQ